MADLYELLDAGQTFVCDGAMGTMLQEAGLTDGGAPELWNVEHPDRIEKILRSYAESGAQLLTTNTFGGTRPRLAMHGLEDRVVELNKAGAEIAKAVAKDFPGTLVLGDCGPLGELLEPLGTMTAEEAEEMFAEQMVGLVAGGADAILIETMSDLGEVAAAVKAAHRAAPGVPVIVTMSFDTNMRTMMGVRPSDAMTEVSALGVRLIGANCGRGTDEMAVIAQQLLAARPDGVHVIVQSNAGLPVLVGDEFRYNGTPEVMGEFAQELHKQGVEVIGACCGSTPAHIAAIAAAIS